MISRNNTRNSKGRLEAQVDTSEMGPKREAFVRLAEKRTNAVIDKIRVLSNCANPYAYEYTDDDVRRIFDAIEKELKAARTKFVQPKRTKNEFKLV
jgi:hypothetical protein